MFICRIRNLPVHFAFNIFSSSLLLSTVNLHALDVGFSLRVSLKVIYIYWMQLIFHEELYHVVGLNQYSLKYCLRIHESLWNMHFHLDDPWYILIWYYYELLYHVDHLEETCKSFSLFYLYCNTSVLHTY